MQGKHDHGSIYTDSNAGTLACLAARKNAVPLLNYLIALRTATQCDADLILCARDSPQHGIDDNPRQRVQLTCIKRMSQTHDRLRPNRMALVEKQDRLAPSLAPAYDQAQLLEAMAIEG
jgi:hypothetical protein